MTKEWLRLKEVLKYYPDLIYLEICMDKDHIHIHLVIPPKYSVAQVVSRLKSYTSRDMRKKFKFLKDVYWGTSSIWSKGYFVSTVGVNDKVIRRYVAMQGSEDAGQAKLEIG
jgi:putative transposase